MVAFGGNALQRRKERLTIENMFKVAVKMAPTEHEFVFTLGNGPHVVEFALERSAAIFDELGRKVWVELVQALRSVGVKTSQS